MSHPAVLPAFAVSYIPIISSLSSNSSSNRSTSYHAELRRPTRPPQPSSSSSSSSSSSRPPSTPVPASTSASEAQSPARSGSPPSAQSFAILMRHGMTDWNEEGRVQGSLDHSRLTANGIRQATKVARYLRPLNFDAVYCSPLNRARHTLELLASASNNPTLSVSHARILDELCEINLPWQGLPRREIRRGSQAELYARYSASPLTFTHEGRNPVADLQRASRFVLSELRQRPASPGVHLVVSHNQTIKTLLCTALDLPPDLASWKQTNCSFNVVAFQPDGRPPILRLCNGSEEGRSDVVHRRARLRHDYVRVFLYHTSDVQTGLRRETSGQEIVRAYIVGNAKERFCVRGALVTSFPAFPNSPDLRYQGAKRVLERIRTAHRGKNVVLAATTAIDVCTFFSVALGMPSQDIARFHSDPGGVSIFDIPCEKPVGEMEPKIECFNTQCFSTNGIKPEDQLIHYTSPFTPFDSGEFDRGVA